MEDAITCNVMAVNMTFAGCVWATGKPTDLNTIVAHAMKRILM